MIPNYSRNRHCLYPILYYYRGHQWGMPIAGGTEK